MTQALLSIEYLPSSYLLLDPRDSLLDPLSGSGTAVTAAQCTGRDCCGIEFDAPVVDTFVRCRRAFTGQSAVEEATVRTFDEIDEETRGRAE